MTRAEYLKQYQNKNKERLKNYRAAYYAANRQKISLQRKAQRVIYMYETTSPEGIKRTFCSLKELAVFFGYNYNYFILKLKKNNCVLGYEIKKIKGVRNDYN